MIAENLVLPSDSWNSLSWPESLFLRALPSGCPLNLSLILSHGGRETRSMGPSFQGHSPSRGSTQRTLLSMIISASLRPIFPSSPSPTRSTSPSLARTITILFLAEVTATSELSTNCSPSKSRRVSSLLSLGVFPEILSECILNILSTKRPPPTQGSAKGIGIPDIVLLSISGLSLSEPASSSMFSLICFANPLKLGGRAAKESVAGGSFFLLLP